MRSSLSDADLLDSEEIRKAHEEGILLSRVLDNNSQVGQVSLEQMSRLIIAKQTGLPVVAPL
jgi:hypothetical protein